MSLLNIFRGISGEWELGRVLWGTGGGSYVVTPVVLQAIDLYHGAHFDAASFCGGYGGGLAAILAAGGVGISQKDKGVAKAQAIIPSDSEG